MTTMPAYDPAAVAPRAVVAVGVTAAAFALAASAFALVRAIDMPQSYSEFVSGYLAWTGKGKFGDLWSLPIAAIVAVASGALVLGLVGWLRTNAGDDAAGELAGQLLWWSLPAAVGFAGLWVRPFTDVALFHLSAFAIVVLLVATALGAGRAAPRTIGFALFCVAIVALTPFEIALLWARLAEDWMRVPFEPVPIALALAGVGSVAVVVLCGAFAQRLEAFASVVAIVGGAGLPLFFALLYREHFVVAGADYLKYPSTRWLAATVVVLGAWAWLDVARRAVAAARRGGAVPTAALSPVALFALLIAIRYPNAPIPQVPADDFHFGERLIGWWSTLRFGALPYVDILPLHGIVDDDVPGYFSALFFDATAATQREAERLAFVAMSLAAFFAIRRATGSVALAFVSASMLGARLAWLFLTPFFCLAVDRTLRTRPARWLALWIVAVPVVVLGVMPHGFAWVAATAPLALWAFVRLVRGDDRFSPIAAAALIGGLAVLALVSPLGSMLVGALRYVAAYAPVNEAAYAIPWDASWGGSRPFIAAELARMSWLAALAIAAALVLAGLRKSERRSHLLAAALPSLVFMLLLVPYTMGRIDPDEISRPGGAANLGWALLVPLMGAASLQPAAWPAVAFVAALGASGVGVFPRADAIARIAVPHAVGPDPRRAVDEGLLSMGFGVTDDAHRDRVRRVRAVLDRELSPDQTYLDLTNRQALYFYTGRRPPLAVPAPYSMPPIAEQTRAIERIERDRVPIALLSADNFEFDGQTLALRTPLLFRFVVDRYEPLVVHGLVFGRLRPSGGPPPVLGEEQIGLLDRLSAPRHLHWLPWSWGRASSTLDARMTPVRPLDAAAGAVTRLGPDSPQVDYDLSAHRIDPRDAGLLALELRCFGRIPGPSNVPRLHVYWWGGARKTISEEASLYANVGNGRLIVPLDAYARYLTLGSLDGLRIRFDNPDKCTAIEMRNVALAQRNSVASAPR